MRRSNLCRAAGMVIAIAGILLVLQKLKFVQITRWRRHRVKCHHRDVANFLEDTCQQYFDGRINGTYCGRLCSPVHGTISVRCPPSHNEEKDKVFFITQNGYDVVLKTSNKLLHNDVKKALDRLRDAQINSSLINFNAILEKVISAVLFRRPKHIPPNIIKDIARECDYDVNGVVSTREALSCLEVVTSKEYLMYKVLYPRPGIPNVFGTCGRLYAVEALDVGAVQDYLSVDLRPWSQRAQMALSFLDVIESLENTPYGVAYLCDVREDNFAVKDRKSVFMIDLDTVLFQGEVSYELNRQFRISDNCSNNADCNDLVSCVTECNKTSGVCQESLLSNNLEVICNHILIDRGYINPGLLHSPPPKISRQLRDILHACCDQNRGIKWTNTLVLSPPLLLRSLRTILLQSLQ